MFPHTSHVESIAVFDLLEDFVPQEFEVAEQAGQTQES
jgi:23S rRNA (uracil1939-C5)-methyltransferase